MTDTDRSILPDALQLAATAARVLVDAGSRVIGAYANGRRPVLIVDAPPSFVHGLVKRTNPNGAGKTTLVYAASFHGCQLEWMRDIHTAGIVQGVGHG